MLYIVTLCIITLWMIALLSKKQLSWHSVVTAYVIGEATADLFEGLFNIILSLYKFPTHLSPHPYFENEYGVIFADFLILPFTLIIFVYYAAKTTRPWLLSNIFALTFITLEWIYLKLGYMKYIHWSLFISAAFYIAGFRFGAYLSPRIATYDPPIPYRIRLLCFSHAILMWVSALFALPLFKLYQFKPEILKDFVADCRVTEFITGDFLTLFIVVFIPMIKKKYKPITFMVIGLMGAAIAQFFYYKGWLVYYHWNHFLMTTVRYLLPMGLIMLYDRWESGYRGK